MYTHCLLHKYVLKSDSNEKYVKRSRYILRRHCRRCRSVISAADVGWPALSAVVFIKTV